MAKLIIGLLAVYFLSACSSTGGTLGDFKPYPQWELVYANDENGELIEGSKDQLIASIRAGKPVRIFTAGRRIEHATDAQFLSIFDGEVFAQITAIESQKPELNPTKILFRKPGVKWRSIIGTNGIVTAFSDGQEPNARTGSTKWFVQG